MENRPLISVCLNCYNAAPFIRRTVEAVLAQTYTHLQVIVVDDCSTDNTLDVLRTIHDERLELVPLAVNDHISHANNEALSRVRGEYVAHVDADDVWYPHKLERQLAFLQEHPQYDACFCVPDMVDENGDPIEDHRFLAENGTSAQIFYRLVAKANYLCHSSMFAKRALLDRVGLHDTSLLYLHDHDYWVRLVTQGRLYILDEPLLAYRVASSGNSFMSPDKVNAHVHEQARLVYRAVTECDDALFYEAFAQQLRRPDLPRTAERAALEKAFVLLTLFPFYPHNRALGLRRLSELMQDRAYVTLAREEFGFTIHDFYALMGSPVYHDQAGAAALTQALDAAQAEKDRLTTEIRALRDAHAATVQALQTVNASHEEALRQLQLITGSRSWKLTAPLRLANLLRTIARTSRHPRTRSGRPAACKLMLYGYYAHNFGDDLFFDILLRRYPDTVFTVFDAENYEAFFARYDHVYVFPRSHPRVQQLDALGAKCKQQDTFERLLLKHCDGVVHIGGSIYQQIGSWEADLRAREKRVRRSRPFFSISSNFGPYTTDSYRLHWEKQFRVCRDICFRDTYSRDLFADIPTVRYAPDLLLSVPIETVPTVRGRLFVSVVDPHRCDTAVSDEQAQDYLRCLSATVCRHLENGGSVCLSSFCAFQNDHGVIDTILRAVPDTLREQVSVISYHGDGEFQAVLTAIAASEAVLATRFHAMLLGLSAGKRVLPICYNEKMDRVLSDLHFAGRILDIRELGAITPDELLNALDAQPLLDIAAYKAKSGAQLDALDAFVRHHGGQIVTA